ncbi:GAF domain-containing protein [Sphingomonas sp. MMS24-JH45]
MAETITVERDWTAEPALSLSGTLHLRDYGSFIDDLKAGETVVVRDCRSDARTRDQAAAMEARGARAFVNIPMMQQGVCVAMLYVSTASPRDWTSDEVQFVRDVAYRVHVAIDRAGHGRRRRCSTASWRTGSRTR